MSAWTSRSLGTRLQHGIFYALIGIGGVRLAYGLLFWVTLWYMFKPEAIRRNMPYIDRRFAGASTPMRWLHRWRRQWELGKALIDRAAAGIRGGQHVATSRENLADITALYKEGKGVVLLSAHVGNWQLAMSVLPRQLPAPVSIVMYRDEGDLDKHYFEHSGETPPFRVIDPSEGPASALFMGQTLLQGNLLSMMGDRAFGDAQVCRVPFLGEDVDLPYMPYYLASVTGAPIVVFFSYRSGAMAVNNGTVRVIRVPANLGKNPAAYVPYARMFAEALEESVGSHPYQFFNFYTMWNSNGHQK